MKNPKSAMIFCNDGFRPVSFYIEALDEDAEVEEDKLKFLLDMSDKLTK